jgi:hypothetical protein
MEARSLTTPERGILSAPKVLLVIPGLLAGFLVPTLLAAPKPVPTMDVGMVTRDFAKDVVTLHRGERLTLVNDSNAVHVIGPGVNTHIASPERGVPLTGFHLMQTNAVLTTGPWMTLGTFYLTCSVHPGMTLKVVVVS